MEVWVFPSKEFIKYEMKTAMKNHEFPGKPEGNTQRKNEGGLSAEEKEMIMQNEGFIEKIKEISKKYGGSLEAVVQFRDAEEIVFNLYVQINEQDIIKLEPMLPEEVASQDVKIEVDFQQIYELIYAQEKQNGQRTESPPWNRKTQPIKNVKEMMNGIKAYFKVRSIMNSAKFSPEESEEDMKNIFKEMFSMMMKGGGEQKEGAKPEEGVSEEEIWEGKEVITWQIILT